MGVLVNMYGIDEMVLRDGDRLMKLNGFWRIVVSLIFLDEKVGKYEIRGMIIGILGMVLIVKGEF
ncbi:hypothetical protein [Staphylococcus epidermidis]|uniref:hypothetical protein n=1 Tax=Staphylococcus epidermidis TaxID=1282 RepID=UPI00119EE025